MLKRILFATAVVAFAAGCNSDRTDTTTTSTSGSTGKTTSTTGGSSTGTTATTGGSSTGTTATTTTSGTNAGTSGSGGSTGSTCVPVADIGTLRNQTPFKTNVCIDNLVTVYQSSYGNVTADGGTQFDGKWVVADSAGNAIEVFKAKKYGTLTLDPTPGTTVSVRGDFGPFPADGGQLELGNKPPFVDIKPGSGPAVPTPDEITNLTDLTDSNANEIGRIVHIPGGNYSEDFVPAELHVSTSSGSFQDGVALTDTATNTRFLVETFTFKFAGSTSCYPSDGGTVNPGRAPDLSAGDFKGFCEQIKGGDGQLHKVVFLANCGQ